MSKLYAAQAIIIKARDFGEADKILTLYTREYGKFQAIAKGVRKSTSRLRGGVQMFAHTRLLLYRGKSLDLVSQAENMDSFGALREDLERLVYASYVMELLEHAVPEREPNERIFLTTLMTLGLLQGEDPELVCRMYEIKLLYLLGYHPHLTDCILCGKPLGNSSFYLSPEQGGLVCQSCAGSEKHDGLLAAGTVLAIQKLLTMDPRQLFRLKISPGQRREMEKAIEHYLIYHLERAINAKKVMKDLLHSLKPKS
ncbi:DNA repair protein RecO [Dehalobacterium formicoaceticum]|uniref:DNA repair protein RecO n=1 Tax=Dehalobacterium formicoaceticum TaxID=51515 RepID=A0ABT1XZJ1_9FIRM|nr:DNA repair protein RecO [Dehalobacterium formicoaceticum]MCR6544035.1 DNA repair protein RecO [Dehalobacterium formicoaceticum]